MRILVIGVLNQRGLEFVRSLGKNHWIVFIDDFSNPESGRYFMEQVKLRKFKFYQLDYQNKKRIIETVIKERIERMYDFTED